MAISFGLPKREVKEEMFPNTPVVTMFAWEGKGFGKKLELNNTALELLDITPGLSKIYFAIDDETHEIYLGKYNSEDSILVGKNNAISNKKFYDYIINHYALDNTKNNYMVLTESVMLGEFPVFKMLPLNEEIEVAEEKEPIKDVEIAHLVEEPEGTPEFSAFKEQPHGHWDDV